VVFNISVVEGSCVMVAVELQSQVVSIPVTAHSRSKVTLQRRKVSGKQLRFNWDEKEQPTDPTPAVAEPVATEKSESLVAAIPRPTAIPLKSRIGESTKLGLVMMRLLKSYGITDEEIIEGLSMS
jgi:hypothetical protein